jgi:hypothetical protein
LSDTIGMEGTNIESCPSCGSDKLVRQGRVLSGKTIRELLCISCKHVQPVLWPVRGRP